MFTVRVADNFHYLDDSETYTHGEFSTWAEAVEAARAIVDRCLAEYYQPGMAADTLLSKYKSFGDDPFVIPVPDGEGFSAWDYAEERCAILCGSS